MPNTWPAARTPGLIGRGAGYAAKGVVYLTIAVLAMREAVGLSGITTGPGDAMRSIGPQPLGEYWWSS
jgi:hypothetical protein